MASEQDYQAALMIELSKPEYGCTVWRQQAGKLVTSNRGTIKLAPEGAADICGIAQGGKILQIECKLLGKKRTPEQLAWAAMIERRGGIYHYAVFDPKLAVTAEAVRVAREIARKTAPEHVYQLDTEATCT